MPGFPPRRSLSAESATHRSARHAHRLTADRSRKLSADALEERRFIAAETGTDYVSALDTFDEPTQRLPEAVAQSLGDRGRLPMDLAIQESELFLAEIARRPDIDPEGPDVELPDGSRMSAFRAAMLQRLARGFKARD